MSTQERASAVSTGTGEVLVERGDAVAVVTLNRPERLNAVAPEHGDVLREAFLELEADPAVRAIVLTGAGRAFCAGADIKGDRTGDAETVLREVWNPLIATMRSLEVPIIAAINGVAAGAGASLAFACDLRVASATAKFQLSFTRIGLMPDAGATWLLPRIVGLGRAMELSLLADDVSAQEAHSWGLVNVLADEGASAADLALGLAGRLAGRSASVGTAKLALCAALERDLAVQLDHEAVTQGRLQAAPDFAEATVAFREKRTPKLAARVPPRR